MMSAYTYTLINQLSKHLAFKVTTLEDSTHLQEMQRMSYYTMILITEGEAKLHAELSTYDVKENELVCLTLYQPFQLVQMQDCKGFVIHFHPDFFCIYKHHNEVACNGILFNNIYQPPYHDLSPAETAKLLVLIEQMREELKEEALAQHELLSSYLKIFLITASRSRLEFTGETRVQGELPEGPFVLQKLKDAIEANFKEKHSASDYASLLNISAKALAKITKTHFNKTLTSMISERIISEAKRELYLTSKPVKAIAFELGFGDEYYFSRFFKNNVNVSPQVYRSNVGFARAEGGLN
ncbi:helix-turn-helix domain-containing protein [Chitinophaga sp. SYP-B3965]|uniref:helix-turn-helix domain-containing protein n=1 Tax=Chitinophaga sp. SYP-B3965 TaxID=2663120 RepID=UPI001299FF49|nr:helix-turn-helix domain-containing protein [Chitinophaga sp. SYP-B3965]MRG43478.1 helix-turn-helix domain-containing protein [Chitinophaga sp. SYP-B3965]